MEQDELLGEIQELKNRISELEGILTTVIKPIKEMEAATQKYLKLVEIALRKGKISPDMLIPEVKDPISKEIVCVLIEKGNLNVSQISEEIKSRRGSSSRKTIRDKLALMQDQEIVIKDSNKKVPTYNISEKVLRKWSKLLGIDI